MGWGRAWLAPPQSSGVELWHKAWPPWKPWHLSDAITSQSGYKHRVCDNRPEPHNQICTCIGPSTQNRQGRGYWAKYSSSLCFCNNGGGEGTDGGKAVGWGVGGLTAALTNVSEAVWGSFGYQGAAGAHSVVFRSWAHWPPEHSQSRHNELLMTLWVTGRERASAHTQHNRGPTQAPHVWCPCAYTQWHTHIRKTLNHTYKCILTRSRAGAEFWGRRTSRLLVSILFVILMSFCMILTCANKTNLNSEPADLGGLRIVLMWD